MKKRLKLSKKTENQMKFVRCKISFDLKKTLHDIANIKNISLIDQIKHAESIEKGIEDGKLELPTSF